MKSFTLKLGPSISIKEISDRLLKAAKTGIPDITEDQMTCPDVESMMDSFSLTKLEILAALASQKPKSLNELADILDKDLGNISKEVKILNMVRMIDIKYDENDKRKIRPVAKYDRIVFDFSTPMKKTAKKVMSKKD